MAGKVLNVKGDNVVYDLTTQSIVHLPNIIRTCIKNKTKLIIQTTMGDRTPDVELCQISAVREIFIRACKDFGLLGMIVFQKKESPKLCLNQLLLLCQITCAHFMGTEDGKYHTVVDFKEFFTLLFLSCQKFEALYGVETGFEETLLDEFMAACGSYEVK